VGILDQKNEEQGDRGSDRMTFAWAGWADSLSDEETAIVETRVSKVVGLLVESGSLKVPLGSRLSIETSRGDRLPVECVGFSESGLYLMPYGQLDGIAKGDRVIYESSQQTVLVSEDLLGCVLNGAGEVIDKSCHQGTTAMPLYRESPDALSRKNVKTPFHTGIKAWDSFLTMGLGQRMGIFAGTGVGKSVLLGMIARESSADVNVLALVGERGHEVREFIDNVLGVEGMKRTVIVVSTSDQSPLMRIRAPFVAKAIAEFFASKGKDVLYMMDSVTRMAMAMRELGLSIGEPPTAKGYPPSVFATMPKLLERAGRFETGSITSIISVLLEGDDIQDPIGDAVRGILDGHVVLDRNLANLGHYPAIEVTESISRWMLDLSDDELKELSIKGRRILTDFKNAEDLINVGAYVKGSNPEIDEAISLRPSLMDFLKQNIQEHVEPSVQREGLKAALGVDV